MGWRHGVREVCLGVVLWAGISAVGHGEEDWRVEMLEAHGYTGKTAELEKLAARCARVEKALDEQLALLGSDDFQTRERAQAAILRAGGSALSWMALLPAQDDPEITKRLTAIRAQLRVRGTGPKGELMRFAVKSLLAERKGGKKTESLVFAEWFERRQNPLRRGYGRMEYHKDGGLTGRVRDGVLRFSGKHKGDGDQCLLLTAKEGCGMDVFPERFRVLCSLGGYDGEGPGGWHVGVSVGQLKVLFHPGTRDGAFRMETVDKEKVVRPNAPMGFEPSTKGFQRMEIEVGKLVSGDVQLEVTVVNTGGEGVFADRVVVSGALIGKLDRVGLWRCGRGGGDAMFDDFVLDLRRQ